MHCTSGGGALFLSPSLLGRCIAHCRAPPAESFAPSSSLLRVLLLLLGGGLCGAVLPAVCVCTPAGQPPWLLQPFSFLSIAAAAAPPPVRCVVSWRAAPPPATPRRLHGVTLSGRS
ncbi:hypothetical protein DQ04_06141010 [Trypanosoma grayi]|uniref:hypothetical protein n=1 Tax=Trypanosoma grayi TaxID=71804 RepID=UPI0004F4849D|nr:hypothetical protein DQ04_06141010 [Trypanosoma grayi]KEG08938.1 hypothetical protein DQ04_06141010 [Trypanosoma grayi]